MRNRSGVVDPDWLGLDWSPWLSLDPDDGEISSLPTDPGLYRVRHREYDGLIYIGETGRSLSGRVHSLASGIYGGEMPFSDPHTASPSLWAIVDASGPGFEVSGAAPPEAEDKQLRKAIEDALIALHRNETGTNLVGNFGRMPPGYSKSKMRGTGIRGGREAGAGRDFREGVEPLPWENPEGVAERDWMGLEWSQPMRLGNSLGNVPTDGGVYRIWDPDVCPPLEYIGESVSLKDRIYRHRRERDGSLRFSYAVLPGAEDKFQLSQVESELLGAHYLACGEAPRDQY